MEPRRTVTPAQAYAQLNRLLWSNRLPKARIVIGNDLTRKCMGLTIQDDVLVQPVIFLNSAYKRWGSTLVHEIVHVAEPSLGHGKLFDALVNHYWRAAKKVIAGIK